MIIDANMYWVPRSLFTEPKLQDEFLRSVPREYGIKAYQTRILDTGRSQIVIEKPKGYQNLNYVDDQYEVETQLKDMDEAGIDKAILKTPGCQEWISLELCKKFNDGLTNHVKQGNGRFAALAVIPPWGTSDCIDELDRCINDLGMKGVQLSAHYGNLYLDAEEFRPFLRKLNEWKLPAYVHHTPLPVQYDSLIDYTNLRRSYGRCVDQATAVGRELFSDLFEELPDLTLIHSMLGGAFHSFMNLMMPKKAEKKEDVSRFHVEQDNTEIYIKKNLYFEMSHAQPWGKIQLESAIQIFGADHVIFGSSYPVRKEWLLEGPGFINRLDLTEEEKRLILGENAERVYKLG